MRRDTKQFGFILFSLIAFLSLIVSIISWYISMNLDRALYSGQLGSPEQLALLTVKQEIFDQFAGIFITFMSLLSALAAILGLGIYDAIRRRIERDFEAQIVHHVGFAQAWMIGATYNEAAFARWLDYEPILQKHLCEIGAGRDGLNLDTRTIALNHVNAAEDMVRSALGVISELDEGALETYLSDKHRLKSYVNILNAKIYSSAARILLSGEPPTNESLAEADRDIALLKDLALGEPLAKHNYRWWEALETIGFFNYHIGRLSEDLERKGRGAEILSSLQRGARFRSYLPAAPDSVRSQIEREYAGSGFNLDRKAAQGQEAS